MKKYTVTSVKKKLADAKVRISGNVIGNWKGQGIKTQGRIDYLCNHNGYIRSTGG